MPAGSPLDSTFDELVSKKLDERHIPGLSISVVHNDQVYAKGYGIACYPSEKVTPSTLFYTGSTTKAFLGTVWAQLIESDENQKKDGSDKISYNTPLAKLIRDDFVLQEEYATQHITIEDAMSHRTGMPGYNLGYGGSIDTPKKVVRSLRHFPLTAELRTEWQYCNVMYIAASHAFETVTGQWLGKTLKEKIWAPLGMESTFFSLQDAKRATDGGEAKLARGYFWQEGDESKKGNFIPEDHMNFPEVSGAGCTISNVLDYAKWLKALMNLSTPLTKEIVMAMLNPITIVPADADPNAYDGITTYGLGWEITSYRGETVVMHTGGLIGFGCYLLYLPDKKWGFAAMGNCKPLPCHEVEESLCLYLLDKLLEVPLERRFDVNAVANKGPKAKNGEEEAVEHIDPRQRLYPSAPSPGSPASLPIKAYAGIYYHPGYRFLTFHAQEHKHEASEETSRVLFADAKDRTWPSTFRLEHVSGEYWISYLNFATHSESTWRAEFRIGPDGKVSELGLEIEVPDKKFWFKRVDSE